MLETVIEVLDRSAREHPERPALLAKRAGAWQTIRWREYRDLVRRTARGLMALGLDPRRGVAIMGANRPEWFLADVGAIAAGGIPAGIYQTNTVEQCEYIARHAEAAVVVVENEGYLARFRGIRDRLPDLRAIVLMEGEAREPGVVSWADMLREGEAVAEAALDARIAVQRPEHPATLIYTSGTTGPPKAVMLSHRNITWVARTLVDSYHLRPADRSLSYLPLSHIAEQVVSLHGPMAAAGSVYFAESLEKLPENLREVRPGFFFAVPRVWEKIQAAMVAAGALASPARRALVAWARRQGLAGGYAAQQGKRPGLGYALARALVFSKVRRRLGLDEARVCTVSAAPVTRETLEFFLSLGIPILEIYGMSECTGPTTYSLPDRYRTGSAGFAIPGTEVRIAEDGEILMRGPHVFMGYLKNEEATRETVDREGWLHSGDIGVVDEAGFLRVTDRKKELIITSGGKNVGPAILEARLKQLPAVAQAVVVGDRRNYLAALLTLDPLRVGAVAEQAGSPARDPASAAGCPVFRSYVESALARVNDDLARYETIKRFQILGQEFTVDGGELTPTLKLKRRVIYQKYADEIERLYA